MDEGAGAIQAIAGPSHVGTEHLGSPRSHQPREGGVGTTLTNDVEPQAYVKDVITKLINGHPDLLDELPPWAYAPKPVAAAA